MFTIFNEKSKQTTLYSANISLISPVTNLYQLCRVHNKPFLSNILYPYRIFPQQVALRFTQLHISLFSKEHLSPYLTFGIIGVLQGGIYGHANVYLAKQLNIVNKVAFRNMFNGSLYAFSRDSISQGAPFLLSDRFKSSIINPLFPFLSDKTQQFLSIGTLSITFTALSHPFHNLQMIMQLNSKYRYKDSLVQLINNKRLLLKGVESRILLLFVTNLFNEIYLKPIW